MIDEKTFDKKIMPMIVGIAKHMYPKMKSLFEFEDLVQMGALAALKGLTRFNDDSKTPCCCFLKKRIIGEMIDSFYGPVKQSRRECRRNKEYPTYTSSDVLQEEHMELRFSCPSCQDQIQSKLDVESILDLLDERDAQIIRWVDLEGLLLKEVAVKMRLSESGVCYLRAKAIKKIREILSQQNKMAIVD